MEEPMTRWYVQRTDSGTVLTVARIREEPDGTYPEIWNGTTWQYWPPAMSCAVDPLSADEVDQTGAEAAIRSLTP
jgi:beta-glucanase (GH16 family)